ncbi:recQ family helicase [Metarhizium guizhouense ARSEF 977]|uniref:DNA 3'-5' helicase n=1 Tax=Metarhizium guizhouense (strain ARSEF 977) TaxID=1276136 RepID=A0A0B4GNC6_METGA|nr:recQ family helicase [Metarhizium guizhouense ARSEF 977]
MVATHVWYGQPGRGPELMTLRHCDTWQLMRNIVLYDGQVMIITDRDKMKAIRDMGRKVARFLPDRLGRMMVAYIAWLLPAEELLTSMAGMEQPREDSYEYVWRHGNSKRWDSDRLSAIMARMLQASTGVRLGIGRYRAVAIEMGRKIRGLVIRQIDQSAGDSMDDDDIEVDPISGEAMHVGGSWNIIWDLQGTHGTAIARQHYAVNVGTPGRLPTEMINSYRDISRLWHQFLEHGNDVAGSSKRKGRAYTAGGKRVVDRAARRTAQDVEEDMVNGLRRLYGPASTWKSVVQRECMQAILRMEGEKSMIGVLPTGAGKSVLFMVPSIMDYGGTNIVVVPFVALMDNIVERARMAGIDCVKFKTAVNRDQERLPRIARLVVVISDVVTTEGFMSYVDSIRKAGELRRIFIDECHTAIMDVGYRAKLEEIRGLHRFKCPVILLTATLPVTLESWFREAMLARSASITRDRSVKANCRYRVEEVQARNSTVRGRVAELVNEIGLRMLSGQKGIVYCRSYRQTEALAEEIGCQFHHSLMSEAARREAREAWADGRGHRWIVATSGLGTGIDISGIVAVIHAEQPYGLVDFVQQTGRGGRRVGEVVESVVVHDGRPVRLDEHAGFVERSNHSQMEVFVQSTSCRRAIISGYMDGIGGETCRDIADAELCDRCDSSDSADVVDNGGDDNEIGSDVEEGSRNIVAGTIRAGGVWKASVAEDGLRVRTMMRWLDEVADSCVVCHFRNYSEELKTGKMGKEKRHKKRGGSCNNWIVEGESYEGIRQRVRFAANACCFKCKLPLDWCKGTGEEVEGEWRCAYMDKVLPVVLIACVKPSMVRLAKEQFDVDTQDHEGFWKWLGQSRRFYGTNGTNMHALWDAMVWKTYRGGQHWFR